MIDLIFYACVNAMIYAANLLGISYQAINIILFVVLQPLLILLLLWRMLYYRRLLYRP